MNPIRVKEADLVNDPPRLLIRHSWKDAQIWNILASIYIKL